jgi:hypothetical protein
MRAVRIRDGGHEAVSALGQGLNEARLAGVIAKHLAQFKHVGAQNLRLNVRFGPKRFEELIMGDQAAGIFNQVTQDSKRLRGQRDL